jgi:hypothetical protein
MHMAQVGKPRLTVYRNVKSDEERLNIKIYNQNVAIEQFAALETEQGVTLSMKTPLGYVDIEMTREFAREIIIALKDELG